MLWDLFLLYDASARSLGNRPDGLYQVIRQIKRVHALELRNDDIVAFAPTGAFQLSSCSVSATHARALILGYGRRHEACQRLILGVA